MIERAKTLSSIGKFIWPIPDRGLPKRAHRIRRPNPPRLGRLRRRRPARVRRSIP